MKKNDVLWVAKCVYERYGFTNFQVIDIVHETEDAISIYYTEENRELWLPKTHIYRVKPKYAEVKK